MSKNKDSKNHGSKRIATDLRFCDKGSEASSSSVVVTGIIVWPRTTVHSSRVVLTSIDPADIEEVGPSARLPNMGLRDEPIDDPFWMRLWMNDSTNQRVKPW
ncbi:Uncharacterized protein Fot_22267 [Forsythia ovata]|uniref:Uncharacterized protein n=1 Tax=Forsythia ovata TaxID=205694 RepID=A0ABD1UX74_9LAMI